jgi:acetylglutamate kinase
MTSPSKQIDLNDASTGQVANIPSLLGKTAVVKFGGTALMSPVLKEGLIDQTISLVKAGLKVVVVHGAGPALNEELANRGIATKKVEGLRVTDATTIKVVVEVMTKINQALVEGFEAKGAKAVVVNGSHSNVFLAKKLELKDKEGAPVDLGWVGEIQLVDLFAVGRSLQSNFIPVIAPFGMDNEGNFYNLNADHAALAVAAALKADNLVFLTDVPGVLKNVQDQTSRIPEISVDEIQDYVNQGIISGGMLPKVKSCVSGIEKGIQHIAIMDGRAQDAVVKGILNPQETGTLIKAKDKQ